MIHDDLADFSGTLKGTWIPGKQQPVFPIGGGYSDQHQREMFSAIRDGDAEAVLNTNPTGGGKTLSWAAPVIRSMEESKPRIALATYPTRALVADQRKLLLSYFRLYFEADDWTPEWDVIDSEGGEPKLVHSSGDEVPLSERVQTVTGAGLDDPEGTASAFRTAERTVSEAATDGLPSIVLTTPDALTLLATGRYSDKDLGALPSLVDLIVVDEFHLTSARGKRLLPFHLDTYLTLGSGELEQLVFLSATPMADYTERIERSFDTVHVTRALESSPPDTGREILPETNFGVTNRPLFQTGEWLATRSDAIENTVTPPGQTLIIVDSVREVEALAQTLEHETAYEVGRVYGWKKEGRAAAIDSCDILVGNTAVEVGVDFDRVNRLIFTAHNPNSALQRLGRMRAQSDIQDYSVVCITTPSVQDAIVEAADGGSLSRPELERIFMQTLHQPGATRPYDDLCATYTRYLWSEATPSLNEMYVPEETQQQYQNLVHTHFGTALQELHGRVLDIEDTWTILSDSPYLDREDIMTELHTFRSSSLNCLVIDTVDTEEPLKQYSLQHVLRYRHGKIIEFSTVSDRFEATIDRPLSPTEREYVDQIQPYVECAFVMTGTRSDARDIGVQELGWDPDGGRPRSLEELRLTISPSVVGLDCLNPLSTDVLVYYTQLSPHRARSEYQLGPYANLLPYRDGTVFLWEDALLAHTADIAAELAE